VIRRQMPAGRAARPHAGFVGTSSPSSRAACSSAGAFGIYIKGATTSSRRRHVAKGGRFAGSRRHDDGTAAMVGSSL